MTTNPDKYTSFEKSKLIAPIMERLKIEPDAVYGEDIKYETTLPSGEPLETSCGVKLYVRGNPDDSDFFQYIDEDNYDIWLEGIYNFELPCPVGAYRKDTLEEALPEWLIDGTGKDDWGRHVRHPIQTWKMLENTQKQKGQPAINALVDLLLLLDENNLLE